VAGVQALVNIEKVRNKKDDCVYLIDFGNVMDYDNIMKKLLIEHEDPLKIPIDGPNKLKLLIEHEDPLEIPIDGPKNELKLREREIRQDRRTISRVL